MATTNSVQIRGEGTGLRLRLHSTGATDLEFISGAFLGSADELRTVVAFLETTDGAPKSFELKIVLFDPLFQSISISGKDIPLANTAREDLL